MEIIRIRKNIIMCINKIKTNYKHHQIINIKINIKYDFRLAEQLKQ
jgi:hypothetical protein